MAKRKKVEVSPTVVRSPSALDVSKIPVEIDGETYHLCFEFSELAKAEKFFRRQGHQFNLLFALPALSLENVRVVFPCAVHKRHPELTFEEAQALITISSVYNVATVIVQVWDRLGAKPTVPAPVGAES